MTCTLASHQLADRLALITALADDALIDGRLRLQDAPGIESRVRELVALEAQCCSFVRFQVARSAGTITIDVTPLNGAPGG
jgi:hypothetical protein